MKTIIEEIDCDDWYFDKNGMFVLTHRVNDVVEIKPRIKKKSVVQFESKNYHQYYFRHVCVLPCFIL